MEKEGCIRGMIFMKKQGLDVDVFVTDRHVQITKWMKDHMTGIQHKFDVWHLAKGNINSIHFLIKYMQKLLCLFHVYDICLNM